MRPWLKGTLLLFVLYLPCAWWIDHNYRSGRYLIERQHRITWSSSDNSNPMTNGRTYWIVSPQ